MKIVTRVLALVASVAGICFLAWLSIDNRFLRAELAVLEAELGHMPIADVNRVYLVEIDKPDVPPEVAPHVERVWQFRCYLPPRYHFVRHQGGGRVAEKGCYFEGSLGSNWGSPQTDASHVLITVTVQRKDGHRVAFYSFGGSSAIVSLDGFNPVRMNEGLVVQKLVSSEQGPRSFDQLTILPLLKFFDPTTAIEKKVAGLTTTTYSGGLFVLYPKSLEADFKQIAGGEVPEGFDPNSIAKAVDDE